MQNQIDPETIKKEVKDFFEKMGFEVAVEVSKPEEQTPSAGSTSSPQTSSGQALVINVTADEPQILIGGGGETLAALQYLLKAILRKKLKVEEGPFYIDLDINDYKKKKISFLKETAKDAADEVVQTGKEKELPPMSSYERRIVHVELAGNPDIVSESAGEEPERRIVIKPRL